MYNFGTLEIIYSSVLFAVLSAARYWLYRNRLRFSLKYIYLIVAAVCLVGGVLWVLTDGIPNVSYDVYRIVFSFAMFALSCIFIKAPFTENAFSYAFILAFTASVETTSFYIRLNFLYSSPEYVYPVISTVIIAAAFVPGIRGLDMMMTRLGKLGSDRVWAWLDLACFSFLFMNLIILQPHPVEMGLTYPISRYLMLLGMVGIYKAVIRMTDIMNAASNARLELSLLQRRISVQQSYYDRMITQMDEVRRMRHDIHHHRAVITALVKSGDTDALSSYIKSASETEEPILATGNLVADSIMLYYTDAANTLGVRLETTFAIGSKTPLSDSDFCIILGNLLENAIDAQRNLAQKDRFIRVTAKGNESILTLAVDNRYDGILKRAENGDLMSRKDREEHGLGLASVRTICEKYGGVLQLDTDKDMFMAGVVIGF